MLQNTFLTYTRWRIHEFITYGLRPESNFLYNAQNTELITDNLKQETFKHTLKNFTTETKLPKERFAESSSVRRVYSLAYFRQY